MRSISGRRSHDGRAARARRGIALAACVLVAGVGAAMPQDRGAWLQPAARPFEHAVHESVTCTRCHGAGEQHRAVLVRTARDCAACHHEPARARDCLQCHARAGLPEPGKVVRTVALSVRPGSEPRTLPFSHRPHAEVECSACHTAPVMLAMERPCGSCHESHHTASTDCSACHAPPRAGAHDEGAHLTCGGAGCHAPAVAPPPALSRALCHTCHNERREHEPESACAECHLLRAGGSP